MDGEEAEHHIPANNKVLSVGELIGIEWKLGVSVQSDSDQDLNAPFVSVLIRTRDSNGKPCSSSFELTIKEFQVGANNNQTCITSGVYTRPFIRIFR